MAKIIKEIRVDVSQPCNLQAILAKQYDCNSRFLKITLTDCGTKIDVSNTSKVTINTNRPDGQSKSFNGTANTDGTVTVPLPQWSLSVVGDLKCDVSVTDTSTNERLTTMDIWVNVIEAANDNTDISENPDGEITVITPSRVINENSTNDEYPSTKAVYEYGQSILKDTEVTATATGKAITIESANAPLQNLKLFGKTEQNGTPTPTSPIELKSVGDSGSFSVGVYGKNLFNNTATTTTLNGVTFTVNADKSVTAVGTASITTTFTMGEFRNLIKGETYYAGGGLCCRLQLKDGTKRYVNSYHTFTYTDDIDRIYAYMSVGEGQTVNRTIYPMLSLGVTDETYEQYKVQSITFTDTMCGMSGKADEYDFTKGTKKKYFKKFVLTGNENWGQNTSVTDHTYYMLAGENTILMWNGLCSHYKILTGAENKQKDGVLIGYSISLIITDSRFVNNVNDFKSFLAEEYAKGTPVTIVVDIEKPTETPLTETELNAYRQLYTNKGTTTILSEADMEVDYYVNKPNAQAIGNIHSQVNKDYLKLQQAIIETGGN